MSENKHSAGPWEIERKRLRVTGRFLVAISDQGGMRFPAAFVPAWDEPGEGEVDGAEEALANARLISAAPEMLSALKAWVSANAGIEDYNMLPAECDARSAAVAAIAKAEGRS